MGVLREGTETLWGWKDGLAVGALTALTEGPGFIPSTNMVPQNCLLRLVIPTDTFTHTKK